MQNWKRTFAILWTGQFISIITSSLVNFAIILWLSIQYDSAVILANSAIASFLPQAVLGLFSGVYVDRWNRKLTMMLADGFIAACTLAISILFYFGEPQVGLIYLLMALRSAGSAFHMPAMQASIPLLAPEDQLLRISGINQTIQSVSTIGGPALGALAITYLDIEYVLLFDVLGAAVAIISLVFIAIPNPEKTAEHAESVFFQVREGIKAVVSKSGMGLLFLFSILVTLFIMPIAILFPLMTLRHFEGGKFEVSIIEVIWGVGMLVGGGFLGISNTGMNKVALVNITYLGLGLALAFSGLLPSSQFILFVVLTGIGGIASSVYYASFNTIIQEKIEPEVLGRVFAMFGSISLFPSIIGLLGIGIFADHLGINQTFVLLGGGIALLGLISFFIPKMMAIDRK
ncbi:MFS transporter [Leadbetterella sp. DM7]|uniref:MFS transporter n=1 Tax=Leadbetterella sp. DM7 TaxID=3235085 RepID=UPI00349E9E97